MSIEIRNVSKQFGDFLALQVRTPAGLLACLPLGEVVRETV